MTVLQHLFDEGEHPVRHVAERKVNPCAGGDDAAGVAEGFEAVLVVIASHAGIADSAERYVFVRYMHYHIVDAAASRRCPSYDFPAV